MVWIGISKKELAELLRQNTIALNIIKDEYIILKEKVEALELATTNVKFTLLKKTKKK